MCDQVTGPDSSCSCPNYEVWPHAGVGLILGSAASEICGFGQIPKSPQLPQWQIKGLSQNEAPSVVDLMGVIVMIGWVISFPSFYLLRSFDRILVVGVKIMQRY